MTAIKRVGVIGGVRIPFCRNNTAYADIGNFGMSVKTLGSLVERYGLHGVELGEVAFGAVIKHASEWNLAREATLSGGEVTVALEREGDDHVLSVTDEGPGVPAELRDRIFDLYFTTKSSGTGLGLPLVAQMVASMGGRVRLDESYGPGARFVVRFPMGKERR